MADAKSKKESEQVPTEAVAADAPKAKGLGIRLMPVDNSDQPVLANYAIVNVAPGMAFIDFGFLEPSLLAAIPRVASQGGKLPQSVNGKLAVRVAMGYDAVAGLHQQLGRVLASLRAASAGAKEKH